MIGFLDTLDQLFSTASNDLTPHPTFAHGDILTAILSSVELVTGEFIGFTTVDGVPSADMVIGKITHFTVAVECLRPATIDEELDYRLMLEAVPEVRDVVLLPTGHLGYVLGTGANPYHLLAEVPGLYVVTLLAAAEEGETQQIGKHYQMDWVDLDTAMVVINDQSDALAAQVEALPVVQVILAEMKTAQVAEAIYAVL